MATICLDFGRWKACLYKMAEEITWQYGLAQLIEIST